MKAAAVILPIVALLVCVSAQSKPSASNMFHNERLKQLVLKNIPITGDSRIRLVDGMWVSESKDPAKALVFPMQVKIICTQSEKTCKELSVELGPTAEQVSITEIDETDYEVNSWDVHGLVASYGGGEDSKCQRHVLTMDFDSGAVSVSDIPTHRKGCEAFIETDSYKLMRGNYYIDTSPNNDMDKPRKQ